MNQVEPPTEYVNHLARQGFHVKDELGRGLSGSVYRAEQSSLNRTVAVKFFDSAFVRDDADMAKRFSREARILAKFQHQSIPFILTEGSVEAEHGTAPYFVMEYVNGQTLAQILRANFQLDTDISIKYFLQILDALSYSHSHSIIHRDIKPGNVMIDSRGRCFLIDFSIGVNISAQTEMSRATKAGEFLGSQQYVSPEQQLDAATANERSDIYSAGVVLFEMLAGHKDRTNIVKSLAGVPRQLIIAIEKACSPDANDRFGSAEEFTRAIGGTKQQLAPTVIPALAICTYTHCGGADWSPNGYYRGPTKYDKCTDSFCTKCGSQLQYACKKCGSTISTEPHCGTCGNPNFEAPLCEKCGSFLTKEYMGKGTKDGCSKCIQKELQKPLKETPPFDEDIPF